MKGARKEVLGIILQLVLADVSKAQLSSCVNADFEQNSFVNWVGTTGTCCPVNSITPGIVTGRHEIMSGPGTDPNTNGAITVVAPGGLYSARLGNDNAGAQAEQLRYQVSVDSTNALFIYRYAVVLEDPSHSPLAQPRFEIRVYDQNGTSIGCGTYNVVASAGIPGFVTITNSFGRIIQYKDWTTVGIDLLPYFGQNITIEFSTGDCAYGAHFGYAYVDCYCSPLQILSDFCSGSGVTTLAAPIGFESYLWSTGDTTPSITINNPIVGTQYQCTMTSVTGCTITLTAILSSTVIASGVGLSGFCQSDIQFYDSSIVVTGSPIVQWNWNFGDGNSSSSQNPIHYYAAPGTYSVMLTVTNGVGCTDSILQNITIHALPVSSFSSATVCAGFSGQFTDGSLSPNGSVVSWWWNFGDGTPVDTLSDPQHAFALPGTYPVTLIIEDSVGCRDTIVQQIATLPGPIAGFSYISTCVSNQVTFNDTSVFPGTSVASREWDFGDGSPVLSGIGNPTHNYPGYGAYAATLIVTTVNGCTDTITRQVDVASIPVAAFTNNQACVEELVQFKDVSVTALGNIVSWSWTFGDGSPEVNSQNPSHIFPSGGYFNTKLIVANDRGCRDSVINPVQIWYLPVPGITADIRAGCEPLAVHFNDSSFSADGVINSYFWEFGNGDTALGSSPGMVYDSAGLYAVSLSLVSSVGCKANSVFSDYIEVFPKPIAAFRYDPEHPGVFLPEVYFYDQSAGSALWNWHFGDSTFSSDQYPMHRYDIPGEYRVTLIITSNDGCKDTTWKALEVQDDYAIWIPNSFTPNSDGINDNFQVKGFGFTDYEMNIFNRFGKVIYTTGDKVKGWDGNYNGNEAKMDVYVYKIDMIDVFGKAHSYTGRVTLVR